jgi:hypothetical protein
MADTGQGLAPRPQATTAAAPAPSPAPTATPTMADAVARRQQMRGGMPQAATTPTTNAGDAQLRALGDQNQAAYRTSRLAELGYTGPAPSEADFKDTYDRAWRTAWDSGYRPQIDPNGYSPYMPGVNDFTAPRVPVPLPFGMPNMQAQLPFTMQMVDRIQERQRTAPR